MWWCLWAACGWSVQASRSATRPAVLNNTLMLSWSVQAARWKHIQVLSRSDALICQTTPDSEPPEKTTPRLSGPCCSVAVERRGTLLTQTSPMKIKAEAWTPHTPRARTSGRGHDLWRNLMPTQWNPCWKLIGWDRLCLFVFLLSLDWVIQFYRFTGGLNSAPIQDHAPISCRHPLKSAL